MPGPLQHAPSDLVRHALIDLGIGSFPPATPWPISSGEEPAHPDNVVTIYDVRGRDHGRNMVDWERAEHHGIQVRVRCLHYAVGYRKARQIAIAFDTEIFRQVIIPEPDYLYFIHNVTRTTDVVYIGKASKDDNHLIFTVNALTIVRSEGSMPELGDATGTDPVDIDTEADFKFGEGSGVDVSG